MASCRRRHQPCAGVRLTVASTTARDVWSVACSDGTPHRWPSASCSRLPVSDRGDRRGRVGSCRARCHQRRVPGNNAHDKRRVVAVGDRETGDAGRRPWADGSGPDGSVGQRGGAADDVHAKLVGKVGSRTTQCSSSTLRHSSRSRTPCPRQRIYGRRTGPPGRNHDSAPACGEGELRSCSADPSDVRRSRLFKIALGPGLEAAMPTTVGRRCSVHPSLVHPSCSLGRHHRLAAFNVPSTPRSAVVGKVRNVSRALPGQVCAGSPANRRFQRTGHAWVGGMGMNRPANGNTHADTVNQPLWRRPDEVRSQENRRTDSSDSTWSRTTDKSLPPAKRTSANNPHWTPSRRSRRAPATPRSTTSATDHHRLTQLPQGVPSPR
jgi:hypothetical protein